jgi:hypothetical protein
MILHKTSCEISHGGEYEDESLLGYNQFVFNEPTFRFVSCLAAVYVGFNCTAAYSYR